MNDSINFTVFGGPMYTYNQLKNGEKTLQQVQEEEKYYKKKIKKHKIGKSELWKWKRVIYNKKHCTSLWLETKNY